jgi:hypothetical protein
MTPAGNILIGTTSIVGPSTLEVSGAAIIGSATSYPISLGVISAAGEALAGALYGSRSANLSILPSTNTALGRSIQLLYQNIGTYLSAVEITGDVTTRVGNLLLMKGGGDVTIGTTLKISPQERTPEVCTAGTPTAGGSVNDGTHSYKITFVTPSGESLPSATSNVITTSGGNNTVPLTAIAKGGGRCTARNIYRRVAGDTGNWKYAGQIANNTATTYSDTLDDASLGADAPTVNTTSNAFLSTVTDSATTAAYTNDTTAALTTAGAKLAAWRNNAVEKASLDKDGKANFSNGSVQIKRSTANIAVAAIPTDAELDAAFGDPTVVGSGFIGILDDNDAGTDILLVTTTGTAGEWFYTPLMTKAL